MKHANRALRLLTLFLCVLMLVPLVCGFNPGQSSADAASPIGNTVRVGLSVPELGTAVFLSSAISESGFSIGTYNGETFSPLFSTASTSLALFPDRNVQVNFKDDGTAKGCALDNGNFGSYSIRTEQFYTDYQTARSAADKIDGFVAFVEGGFEVRYGSFATESDAQSAVAKAGHTVASPAKGGLVVADCNTGKRLLEYERTDMLALRAKDGGEVSLNNYSGRKSYLGFFAFSAPSYMKVINVLDLELYVKCVMANEIGTNVSVETRRVFSVLIRTVPMNRKHDKYGMDVCNTECCQVYLGSFRRDAENDAIVDSTKGEYITYQGTPINCLYHSSNGGASCSSVAAWGGTEIPYLTSVTLGENIDNPSEVWQYTFTKDGLYAFLSEQAEFAGLAGSIADVTIDATDPYGSGYVTALSVTDKFGGKITVETSEVIRRALRFESANFTVTYETNADILTADGVKEDSSVDGYLDADGVYHAFDSFEEHSIAGTDDKMSAGRIVFDGVGTGHGVGLSSVGSEQLVSEGYSYRYIIAFYFQGTEISKV